LRCLAIECLSSFKDISIFEEVLREKNEDLTHSVYKSVAMLTDTLLRSLTESRAENDTPYTYSPELEDRIILDIRVLLGKMTPNFDSYSRKVKLAFISAMISSNHREFIIYTMKALTSDDSGMVDLTLHLLLANVSKLRDPDKLFRNLLALSADSARKSEILVSIFERYFLGLKENRTNSLFRDKMYNYIVVTLETYFETYRKEFMITEVIEKDFPESFRSIRKFLLERLSPALKKRILHFLRNDDRTTIQPLLVEICENIPYFEPSEKERIQAFLEVLFDKDQKSRINSSVRIEDINFEKRYLRDRIVRICDIIGRLKIDGAASLLVKIFNYVKKYPDEDVFNAVARGLSMLNYSYMLGELEIQLASGDAGDQRRAVGFLSLFTDQRALNILLDYMKDKSDRDVPLVTTVLHMVLQRDISGNMAANSILKHYVERNPVLENRRLALLCVGKCGIEADVEYLNELFAHLGSNEEKESVVQALGYIIQFNPAVNRRQVVRHLAELLKDAAIKVRIYACSILIQLGNKDALKFIRDMMVIKNKYFQREILGIIGNQKSMEFSYFLISLLKAEYGIESDIIATLALLNVTELQEIDQFAVNVLKKYAGGDVDLGERREAAVPQRVSVWTERTMLNLEIHGYLKALSQLNVIDFINVNRLIDSLIVSVITQNGGVICRLSGGRVSSFFNEPAMAADSALQIQRNIGIYNLMRLPRQWTRVSMQIITGRVKMLGEDAIELPEFTISAMRSIPIVNRVLIDEGAGSILKESYHFAPLPDIAQLYAASGTTFLELISPVNSLVLIQGMLNELTAKEQEKLMVQMQLEAELKKLKSAQKTGTSIEYAQAMDEIAKILKADLAEVVRYVQKRSTDRELINTVEKMISNINKRYILETTKIIMQ
jgi:HEAT repeat protein